MGEGPLVAAFAVALLLHLLGLAGLAYMNLHAPESAGEQEISIDLTPRWRRLSRRKPWKRRRPSPCRKKPSLRPSRRRPIETQETPVPPPPPPEVTEVVPQEVTPPPPTEMTQVMPEEVEPPPPPPEAVAEMPPETPPPPPEEQVITSQAPEAEPLAPPPPVVVKPKEPVKPKPKEPDPAKIAEARRKELLERKREAERREVREEQRKAAIKAKAERDAVRRATQNAQGAAQANQQASQLQRSGGGNPNALAAWKSMLSSTIRGRMNRNAASGTGGGVATVRFTVTRSGSVTSASLASSSGVPAIDSAALAAVRGSLPPAPLASTSRACR
ncbi:cell envelope integrity protein TolA [Methylorubrum suomiense]